MGGGGGALQLLRVLSGVNKSRLIKRDIRTRPPPQNQNLAGNEYLGRGGGTGRGPRGWPRNNRVALRKCSVSSKIYDERSRKETDAPVEHRVGMGAPSKTRVGVGRWLDEAVTAEH